MRQVILFLLFAAVMLMITATSASAGSLFRGQELTIPSDGSGILEKVCQSTTAFGDAVTHADAAGLSTSTSEGCI